MRSSSSSTSSGPTSRAGTCTRLLPSTHRGAGASAAGEPPVTNAVSRIVIALAVAPLVLGGVYLGGWWVFALAAIAAVLALHEYWLMARTLRPLAPAGHLGVILGLV